MAKEKKTILVPWDFTEVAENALQHAINISNVTGSDIRLINIVKKEKDEYSTKDQLKEITQILIDKYQKNITSVIKTGSLFTAINDYAEEIGAILIVMGTHGIVGMQKLMGSKALKVIEGSEVPYLVVQNSATKQTYNNIVVPMDFRRESKEKLIWVNFIAKKFNSKVRLVAPKVSDSSILEKTNANINFAKRFFEERNIDYNITTLDGKGDFHDLVVEFAEEINSNMIVITTTKNINIGDYIFGADEQEIIANNSKIPVLCINPNPKLTRVRGFWG